MDYGVLRRKEEAEEEEAKPPSEDVEPPSPSSAESETNETDHAFNLTPVSGISPSTKGRSRPRPVLVSRRPVSPTVGPAAQAFWRRFFPQVSLNEWNNWRWQLRHRITSLDLLARMINLSPEERAAFADCGGKLPFSVTPYYLSLVDPDNPAQPLRRCVIPTAAEHVVGLGEQDDPLGEDHDTVVPGLVHRYPDRVLLLVTSFCSTYCRYCTRSRLVGGHGEGCRFDLGRLEKALAYIEANPAIRDVLVSGGDPLTMSEERLDWVLSRLRGIKHVELVRLGTKVPAVLPQRITPALVRVLKRYHPLFMSIHFTHPAELTPETGEACSRLADAGLPLGSQTVLLAGINDNVATMKELVHGLLRIRVRPYYLYQCDPITGSAHFRTPVSKGLEIIQGLRGHTTGYAVPTYVIDAPGGGGKVALYPESVVGREGPNLLLRNYGGLTYNYPDTLGGPAPMPN